METQTTARGMLQDEIRILYLHPHNENSDAPVKCDLRVVSLADNPKYEALSYVWGNRDSLIDIEVSESKVGVTVNLYSALRQVRLVDKPRPLWIDQLCINQWDIVEKAQQVRMMRQIYTKCQGCLLWMGEIAPEVSQSDAKEALELVNWMAAVSNAGREDGVAIPHCLESDAAFEGPIKALKSMLIDRNPWWRRVWTVQEAVLPPTKSLLWGPLVISWESLSGAANAWTRIYLHRLMERLTEESYHHTVGELIAMVVWLNVAKLGRDRPAWLVQRWRFREATDPRDKIYALMGLCQQGRMPCVETCDYGKSVVDVFCDMTYDLLRDEQSLLPLSMDLRLEYKLATPGLPRWVLDASHISEFNTDWFPLYAWPHYNAHGGRPLDFSNVFSRWEKDKSMLELRGVFVDTIEIVMEPLIISTTPQPKIQRIQSMLDNLRSWELIARTHVKRGTAESEEPYPGGYTLREAFGRLVLGDLIRDNEQWVERPATNEDVESVYRFIESGRENETERTIQGMMQNQRFFVTKNGLIGLGHMETHPGEEVWVFHGGNYPFTVIPREGSNGSDYDFGGRCYVQGVMNGEAFEHGQDSRVLTIH